MLTSSAPITSVAASGRAAVPAFDVFSRSAFQERSALCTTFGRRETVLCWVTRSAGRASSCDLIGRFVEGRRRDGCDIGGK